ncbi:sigma-54 dependent transcriptional regulator [Altererythrobacter sp. KTW20L]|uniref:sigma-54-dependent transcriptional regulator n=1 Tax=Altererythrobacter sp. KTW20L TaxID=2942210 RepID=UPI0020C143B1|nr:sigma-54 dependent transcriptional regulator [Altererythrobacter sp. KTW20L]MCL6251092.1 sigma-54 dependent transcriptional regulator [Altererythrobacter sp. KTW20L]
MARRALLVEDDASIAMVITAALEDEAFTVDRCDRITDRDRLLAVNDYDVMLTDVILLDGDGIETLGKVTTAHPAMPIIILSAQNTLDTAVRASDTGAFEYFPKPFDLDELVRAACQAADSHGDAGEEEADPGEGLPLIGRSQPMQDVYRMITRVLRNDLTVLILGESGTGKELVAEAIHQLGSRRSGPFVAVNTAAIPRELIESELFGHEKGAFTGATSRNIGKFEQANEGTLFLDEIGDMPPEAQTRLLRALQSGRIRRVGGEQEIAIDVRIIAATNRNLEPMIAAGSFREDLFYRLNVVPIQLPPLRDRTGDIEPLARHFLRRAVKEGLPQRRLSKAAADMLSRQPWRGNVRELRNFMFRAALLAREEEIDTGTIETLLNSASVENAVTIDGNIDALVAAWLPGAGLPDGDLYHRALAVLERPLFEYALSRTGGNQLRAAQLLGINRNTLRKRLGELDIDPERFSS